ncbi:hypothetical protein G432_12355 [Sphingomonas sp. MM-1]|uniref:hypothetical protein n=1 Tax=Sphingomonas sp. MM-1 TaxID=745310 RepID=UPI0002C10EAE|nr:hypothetical protein [Sphingomonas sp. MM-1]AGH50192.1 hypothetical protein G432_12355 [Sphingomonas sp. MM-1]
MPTNPRPDRLHNRPHGWGRILVLDTPANYSPDQADAHARLMTALRAGDAPDEADVRLLRADWDGHLEGLSQRAEAWRWGA